MNNWQYAAKLPTTPWRGQMSLPRRLSVLKDDAGWALVQTPMVAPLRTDHSPISTPKKGNLLSAIWEVPFELELRFSPTSEQVFGIRIYSDAQHWTEIGFDQEKKSFYIDRTKSGIAVTPDFPVKTTAPLVASRPYDLRVIVDRSSVEAYAQSGTIAMTDLIFPRSQTSRVVLFSASEKAVSVKGDYWKLSSIWKKTIQ
jgi:fructan beta-fructosidase